MKTGREERPPRKDFTGFLGTGVVLGDHSLQREREEEESAEKTRRVRCYQRYVEQYGKIANYQEALAEGQRLLDERAPLPSGEVSEALSLSAACQRCGKQARTEGREDLLCPQCRSWLKQKEAFRGKPRVTCIGCGKTATMNNAQYWLVLSSGRMCRVCERG